jgi:hypothetical protein
MTSKKSKSKSEAHLQNVKNFLPGIKRKPVDKPRRSHSPTYELLVAVNQNFLAMGYSFDHVRNVSAHNNHEFASSLNNNTKSPTPVLSVKFDSTTELSEDYEEKKEKLDIWIPAMNPIDPITDYEASCASFKKQIEQATKTNAPKVDLNSKSQQSGPIPNLDDRAMQTTKQSGKLMRKSVESGENRHDTSSNNITTISLTNQNLTNDDRTLNESKTDLKTGLQYDTRDQTIDKANNNYLTNRYKGDLTSSDLYKSININRLKGS